MTSWARYFHTIRYLRPVQVFGRIRHLVAKPRPDLRDAPAARARCHVYARPVAQSPMLIGPDTFRFLNEARRCSGAEAWDRSDVARLWTYNLHYFDDLNALRASARLGWHQNLLTRWVTENPPCKGIGWEPYPVSRRIVNWVKWACVGNELPASSHTSLAIQARWLSKRLEYHILGNHLLVNAKALIHAGLYFKGEEADGWYSHGIAICERELREQVLDDGGHFELSTMYHATAIEDLLDVINLQKAYGRPVAPQWLSTIARMRRWLRVMTHPDGEISFFNDAAFAVAPKDVFLDSYAARLGLIEPSCVSESLVLLPSSGYVRGRVGNAYLICDCAQVGPEYQPGHAHADTLSFELSIAQQRVFVNSGTSEYGSGNERLRQRGTAAHNTVSVDGRDSSEVWGGFRVARRARVYLRNAAESNGEISIEASHDGYRRLPGANEHRRRWTLCEGALNIVDSVTGPFGTAEAYFHLSPAINANVSDPTDVILRWAQKRAARLCFQGADSVHIVPTTWHPQFGMSVTNRSVVARFSGPSLLTSVHWTT